MPTAPNDTERDYNFWKGVLTPEQFQQRLQNKEINPPHFGVVDGVPAMIGGYQGPQGPTPAHVQALLSGHGSDAQFDEKFGAGAAARARGGQSGAPAGNFPGG
jgi:hypothetical protein